MSGDERRLVEFDFLRATEQAVLHPLSWLGKGQKESADEAACDVIHGMFDHMDMRGEVVIVEGGAGPLQGRARRALARGLASL